MHLLEPIACATCSLDAGAGGQTLMLVTMIATPFVALIVGIMILRRLVRKLHEGFEP